MQPTPQRYWLLLLLIVSLACAPWRSTPTAPPATPTVALTTPSITRSPVRYEQPFIEIWELVRENYVYNDYNGVDWDAVRDEFTPRVAQATSDEDFWLLMQEMIERLDDQHSGFLTPEQARDEDQSLSGNLDYVGIGVYLTVPKEQSYAVVLLTFPDSPAEAVGIRAHDRILEIDGTPACCDLNGYDNLDLISGPEGTPVTLTVQTPGSPPRQVTAQRARIQAQLPTPARRIATPLGDVGYILIPTFWDTGVAKRAITTMESLLAEGPIIGWVIDMRINGGGAFTQLYPLLALFVEGNVGHFLARGDEIRPLEVQPAPLGDSQTLPLVILIGPETASYGEVFSGALQAVERALLVGEPTAGNVETVYLYDLKDGSRLWLAQETFVPVDGAYWEGVGVQPDILALARWEDISDSYDPGLQAALEALQATP